MYLPKKMLKMNLGHVVNSVHFYIDVVRLIKDCHVLEKNNNNNLINQYV